MSEYHKASDDPRPPFFDSISGYNWTRDHINSGRGRGGFGVMGISEKCLSWTRAQKYVTGNDCMPLRWVYCKEDIAVQNSHSSCSEIYMK
ncbi:hypothetical protein CEXT_86971 [Caerostris extrusa]|uniref:Uncharacterized protein n=1 Tax=Caerostris extrusa TaxID=172846 RepID=A0AAV4SR67_CAEEX|nr:hypothetical protein CEXT_86971 [Caerostris extrusa]